MKKLAMLGGFLGFSIGIVFGSLHDVGWPALMWRASVAALAAGFLMRWWGRLCLRSLRESLQQPRLATEAAAASPPAQPPRK